MTKDYSSRGWTTVAGIVASLLAMSAAKAAGAVLPAVDFIKAQPEALQPYFQVAFDEGERSAVLNFAKLGVAAMTLGQHEIATKALDQAIQRVDMTRTGGADVKAAKSNFNEEASKDFKGEPYERGMLYYYRGLEYLREGKYDTAAASFAAVNVEDMRAEGQSYQSDFASMKLLQAWSLSCFGETNTSTDAAAQAVQLRAPLKAVDHHKPVLVVVEKGGAPKKVGSGTYNERLSFAASPPGPLQLVKVSNPLSADEAETAAMPAEDLFFQASTRGGRPIEYLLAGKATFKSNMATTSKVSGAIGVGFAQAAGMQADLANQAMARGDTASANAGATAAGAGLAIAAVGGLVSMFSGMAEKNANPAADTRTWDSLPGVIELATVGAPVDRVDQLKILAGDQQVKPALMSAQGSCAVIWAHAQPLPGATRNARLKIDDTRDAKDRLKKFQERFHTFF
ncbi:MAG: hypothetical protein RLZZ200_2663 [Pseudomonadota bacterium]|jgi:hypothetical protein